MQTSLHQNACTPKRNGLINLRADFVERSNVSVGRARASVKRAKRANDVADVCVVDIAIDDVGDYVVRMPALPYFISGRADCCYVVRFK
jgi:hypothetical protein